MKQKKKHQPVVQQPIFPNAADTRYFTGRALEILAAVVTGTSAITVMLFFAALA